MKNYLVIIWPIFLIMCGCASLNSKFDCPMRSGIRCESLDAVNARVDRGEIGHEVVLAKTVVEEVNVKNVPISPYELNLPKTEPVRFEETVMRIWIAPYEDTAGNYHEHSEVFTVIRPGFWVGQPPKEIDIDEI